MGFGECEELVSKVEPIAREGSTEREISNR